MTGFKSIPKNSYESRAFTMTSEVREQAGTVTLEGYASTFNTPYDMGFYTETVDPKAFNKTLADDPDVRLLVNHDGLPLARTRSGTLKLSADSRGLHVSAELDATDPDVQGLAPKMKRGDLDQMSFGFRTLSDEWDEKYTERRLMELSLNNGDVSVVTYPANPSTSAGLRAMVERLAAGPGGLPFEAIMVDLRAGKVLSSANVDLLKRVLETLALVDSHVDAADADLDKATADLSSLLNVVNPDPADPAPDAGVLSAPRLTLMRAQVQRLALARKV